MSPLVEQFMNLHVDLPTILDGLILLVTDVPISPVQEVPHLAASLPSSLILALLSGRKGRFSVPLLVGWAEQYASVSADK